MLTRRANHIVYAFSVVTESSATLEERIACSAYRAASQTDLGLSIDDHALTGKVN